MRIFVASTLLMLATPALAQTEAQTLYIGTEAFKHADIVDARALPEMDAGVVILVTLTETASKRLEKVTQNNIGKPITLRIGRDIISNPIVRTPIRGGSMQINVEKTLDDATTLAKTISGKDPLPDSLEGE
jgi:preprotein translocase subunit SecD